MYDVLVPGRETKSICKNIKRYKIAHYEFGIGDSVRPVTAGSQLVPRSVTEGTFLFISLTCDCSRTHAVLARPRLLIPSSYLVMLIVRTRGVSLCKVLCFRL